MIDPDLIFHYTGLAGLQGIIEDQKIFATDIRFLNDPGESTFGMQRLRTPIDRFVERCASPSAELTEFQTRMNSMIWEETLFATCFCKDGNLLSQWRGYARQGYALGFSRSAVEHLVRVILYDLIYNEDEQAEIVNRVLQEKFGHLGSGVLRSADAVGNQRDYILQRDDILRSAAIEMLQLLPRLKHHSFEEEQESRAVQWYDVEPRDGNVRFRDTALGPTPYVSTNIGDRHGTSALRRIVIGPTPHRKAAKIGVDLLLKVNDLEGRVEVMNSPTPFRWQ